MIAAANLDTMSFGTSRSDSGFCQQCRDQQAHLGDCLIPLPWHSDGSAYRYTAQHSFNHQTLATTLSKPRSTDEGAADQTAQHPRAACQASGAGLRGPETAAGVCLERATGGAAAGQHLSAYA